MARGFKLVKLGEAALVGVVDVGLEKVDESMNLSFPLNAQTIARAGLFALGVVGDLMVQENSKWHGVLETMYVAETPLLIRTAAKAGHLIADYEAVPSREAIELRLRSAGQVITNPPRGSAQFR